MTHHTDAERAKFEAWCDSNEYDRVTRLDGSGYNNEKTKRAWLAWQAALAATQPPEGIEKDAVRYQALVESGNLAPSPFDNGIWGLRYGSTPATKAELDAAVDRVIAAQRTTAIPVPVNLLERIQESLGSFVSDQGWSQSDMDTADALDGLLTAVPRPAKATPTNVWQQAVDHALVSAHLGVAGDVTAEEATKILNDLICWNIQVATDPLTNGGKVLVSVNAVAAINSPEATQHTQHEK